MTGKVFLGFEVQTGKEVWLSVHHLAIFGMTQLSGKTTTLEALITRSGLRAIAFKTKRGEAGFTAYNLLTPYYKSRADWQFVEGLVNVALGEKVKYEPGMRYAIMKVCRGRHDLKQIQTASKEEAKHTRTEFMRSVYEKLDAYLDIVIPELEKYTFSESLELKDGVNVMDLSTMRLETQHLVIASTIEYAFSHLDHIVVIIPEAWETIPQGKMTPVKWVAQQFIRKGAAIGNYLWLDSQDIGGIDKTPLRQCDNWLMGRMKEAHEVERILKQLLGMKVPAEEIQTLSLGHFYAAIGNDVKKVYVLPSGVPQEDAKKVAMGLMKPEQIKTRFLKPSQVLGDDELVWKEKYESLEKRVEEIKQKAFEDGVMSIKGDLVEDHNFLASEKQRLEKENESLKKDANFGQQLREAFAEIMPQHTSTKESGQTILNLNHAELTVNLSHSDRTIEMDTTKQQGQILYVAINDLPKEGFTESELSDALNERGWPIAHSSLAPTLASNLPKMGLLIKLEGTRPTKYKLPSKLTIAVEKK